MGGLGLVVALAAAVYLLTSLRILAEYERGIIFRLGRLLPDPRGPGIVLVYWPVDTMVRVSLRPQILELPIQEVLTRDGVALRFGITLSLRVLEPRRAVVEVANYSIQTAELARAWLQPALAELSSDEARALGDAFNQRMVAALDEQAARWGIKIDSVAIREMDGPGTTPHVPGPRL